MHDIAPIGTRFKIDRSVDRWSIFPIALYHLQARAWLWPQWVRVSGFDTVDEARTFYETIKNLPEYLP